MSEFHPAWGPEMSLTNTEYSAIAPPFFSEDPISKSILSRNAAYKEIVW